MLIHSVGTCVRPLFPVLFCELECLFPSSVSTHLSWCFAVHYPFKILADKQNASLRETSDRWLLSLP